MRNVILFVIAAAALAADAKPSHSDIAVLLGRQLAGSGSSTSSTGSSSIPGLDPSSIGSASDCTSTCAPLSNIANTCSTTISCLCSQKNYDALAPCLQCVSPDYAQSSLNAFVSDCQQAGYTINSSGSSSSGDSSSGSSSSGPAGTGSSAGAATKQPGSHAKSNASVAGPNVFGALALSAVAATVTIATLGVSFG